MGQVIIQFEGLCVNFRQDASVSSSLPVPHRIVLPVAGDHEAGFSLSLGLEHEEFSLTGAILTIENAVVKDPQHPVTYDSCFEQMPNLTAMAAAVGKDLGPFSPAVVLDELPAKASCYFDITAGHISAVCQGLGAFLTTVKIDTGDETPRYKVVRFPTAPPPPSSGGEIPEGRLYVWNECGPGNPCPIEDFLFSYHVAEVVPGGDLPLAAGSCPASCITTVPMRKTGPVNNFVDIGCSNSNYP